MPRAPIASRPITPGAGMTKKRLVLEAWAFGVSEKWIRLPLPRHEAGRGAVAARECAPLAIGSHVGERFSDPNARLCR